MEIMECTLSVMEFSHNGVLDVETWDRMELLIHDKRLVGTDGGEYT